MNSSTTMMATSTATTASAGTATSTQPLYIDTQHEDLVHDAQMDYYGSKLATCSSDRTIKIYNVSETSSSLVATIQAHEGPVWQVAWAHPQFGTLLASCSFDGTVAVHREQHTSNALKGRNNAAKTTTSSWNTIHVASHLHESSVNGVQFCPREFGLQLAAASSDGRVSVLRHEPNQIWTVDYLPDCPMGVNAVSWAPYGAYYNPNSDVMEAPRLVTAGCDHQIRFWICQDGQWAPDAGNNSNLGSEHAHADWVRDVAWAPCLLPGHNRIASGSEDGTVIIWTQSLGGSINSDVGGSAVDHQVWKPTLLHKFDAPVWRVSWSVTGHILAVSSGDADITLWKQGLDDKWMQMNSVTASEASSSATTAGATAGGAPGTS